MLTLRSNVTTPLGSPQVKRANSGIPKPPLGSDSLTLQNTKKPVPLQQRSGELGSLGAWFSGKAFDSVVKHYVFNKALKAIDSGAGRGSALVGLSKELTVADANFMRASIFPSMEKRYLDKALDQYSNVNDGGLIEDHDRFNKTYAKAMMYITIAKLHPEERGVQSQIENLLPQLTPSTIKAPNVKTVKDLWIFDRKVSLNKTDIHLSRENAMGNFFPSADFINRGETTPLVSLPNIEGNVATIEELDEYDRTGDIIDGRVYNIADISVNGRDHNGTISDHSTFTGYTKSTRPSISIRNKAYTPVIPNTLIKLLPSAKQAHYENQFLSKNKSLILEQINSAFSNVLDSDQLDAIAQKSSPRIS
jgi:hypothetical protein